MNKLEWTMAIEEAVNEMSIVKFFPAEAEQRAAVGKLLMRMLEFGRADQLKWLVMTMLDRVNEWNGPVELRAVFCTRFRPADGIEADSKYSPGFTAGEMETRAKAPGIERADELKLLEELGIDPNTKRLN
jgi:hypothetical protein